MVEMPTYDKMLWPTLQALKNTDGSASNQELLPKVIQIMGIPEEIQNVPHGAGPRTEVEYRLYWARYYLRKVGAIESSARSIWIILKTLRLGVKAEMVEHITIDANAFKGI
jgi:restriction system protein